MAAVGVASGGVDIEVGDALALFHVVCRNGEPPGAHQLEWHSV